MQITYWITKHKFLFEKKDALGTFAFSFNFVLFNYTIGETIKDFLP